MIFSDQLSPRLQADGLCAACGIRFLTVDVVRCKNVFSRVGIVAGPPIDGAS